MSDILRSNEWLDVNEALTSNNGRYQLILEPEGSLILYRREYPYPLWSSRTKDGIRAIMRSDGDFVLYDTGGKLMWASGTSGAYGSYLILQNDGNLAIYRPRVQEWELGTGTGIVPITHPPAQIN